METKFAKQYMDCFANLIERVGFLNGDSETDQCADAGLHKTPHLHPKYLAIMLPFLLLELLISRLEKLYLLN